jgi:hypothetical protein
MSSPISSSVEAHRHRLSPSVELTQPDPNPMKVTLSLGFELFHESEVFL